MQKSTRTIAASVLILLSTVFYSCEQEESIFESQALNTEQPELSNNLSKTNNSSITLLTECDISGPSNVSRNTTVTYTFTSNIFNRLISWSVVSGDISIVAGQNTNRLTVRFGNQFNGGSIRALGIGDEVCSETKYIGATTPPLCPCPGLPIIDDLSCVSGGHPHWRFEANNVPGGTQIRWYAQNASILSGQGTKDVIVKPSSSSGYGFTLYCEVTKLCGDGSKKIRTAYYSNYYGGSCGNGTTGEYKSCGSGPVGGEWPDDVK